MKTAGLFIFDLDGTLYDSVEVNTRALNLGLQSLGQKSDIPVQTVRSVLGSPSEDYYRKLAPDIPGLSWQDVRTATRNAYGEAVRSAGNLFAETLPTLRRLRDGGFNLAIVSYASAEYFHEVNVQYNLGDYFDAMECCGARGMSKSALVAEVIGRFPSRIRVMTGDREEDIAAGRKNDCLTIHASWGFGCPDTEADLAPDSIEKLQAFSTPVGKILLEILYNLRGRRLPPVVFITGIDGSGKSTLSRHLAELCSHLGKTAHCIHGDDFHNPRSVRTSHPSGPDSPEAYRECTFNYDELAQAILKPLRESGALSVEFNHLRLETDTRDKRITYSIGGDDVVFVEGVFLLDPTLTQYAGMTIFLSITEEECIRRVSVRDEGIFGSRVETRYRTKYLPGQRLFLSEFPPETHADIIIDANDTGNPFVVGRNQSRQNPSQ